MNIRKVRSKTGYDEIIEVLCPIRFYWIDGKFDGIELGPFGDKLTRYQYRLITRLLDTIDLTIMAERKEEPVETFEAVKGKLDETL